MENQILNPLSSYLLIAANVLALEISGASGSWAGQRILNWIEAGMQALNSNPRCEEPLKEY